MRSSIVRFTAVFLASSLLFALSVIALSGHMDEVVSVIFTEDQPSGQTEGKPFTVILDAGHGGEDGGAQGLYGACEKDLNLAVTLRARDLLEMCGVKVILTRGDDRMLGDGAQGARKLSDLRARLDLANSTENALLISVHMNKFPLPSCKGVQIFYSGNDGDSLRCASIIHGLVGAYFGEKKPRELKEATSAIYLLDRARIPAVLIECGFLSNEDDAKLLTSKEGQDRYAALILSAVSAYLRPER